MTKHKTRLDISEEENVPNSPEIVEPKQPVRLMCIEMMTKGQESDGVSYAPDIIQYQGTPEDTIVHKQYLTCDGRKVRREKYVDVRDVHYKGVPTFKNALEMFTYFTKNCGYKWVH